MEIKHPIALFII